jgi:hypothetical protein
MHYERFMSGRTMQVYRRAEHGDLDKDGGDYEADGEREQH